MFGSRTGRVFGAALTCWLVAVQSHSAHGRVSLSDQLLAHVPSSATVVVSTNHSVLSKHPHYLDVLRFMVSRGWGGGLEALSSSGVDLAGDAKVTVNYRTAAGGEGIVTKLRDLAALRKRAKSAQGAAFKTGEIAGHPTFSLNGKLTVVELGAGVIVVATSRLTKGKGEVADKKNGITKKKGYAGLSARAKKLGTAMWGVAFVPKSLREPMTLIQMSMVTQ